MSKKITEQEFLSRFKKNYPNADIEIVQYTAISNPGQIKCLKCNKILNGKRARQFLNSFNCCGAHDTSREEKIKKLLADNEDFSFIKKVDKDHMVIRHNKCGNETVRAMNSALDNPFSCLKCETNKLLNRLSLKEAQAQIDNQFFGAICILEYNGQTEKRSKYKCLKCGLIFEQKQICLLQSKGCPKCDRNKSKGEKMMAAILQSKCLNYKEQVQIKELPLQYFDFGVYDEFNKLMGYIEVQGEQHRKQVEIFKDSLEKIQERDERKRRYCKENQIPLYEIIYQKGKLLNLDILPF